MTLSEQHKKLILAGVAGVGTLAVLYYLWQNGQLVSLIPSGTISDITKAASPGSAGGSVSGSGGGILAPGNSPGYTGYNMAPLTPVDLPTEQALANAAPAGVGACCSKGNSCYAGSPLDTGSAYSSVNALLDYYKSTNPYYVQLVKEQTAQYAAMFISGSQYSGANYQLAGITGP